MQARWGSHGLYGIIAIAPSSPQEMYDLTITAFDLSEKYRTPVLIMSDESVGHMSERVTIPPASQIKTYPRRKPKGPKGKHLPYKADADLVPPMGNAGEGYRYHVTGLTHDERGYPDMTAEAQQILVRRLLDKIELNKDDIIQIEEDQIKGADVVVCSYGISARVALLAVKAARDEGIKVGMMRLITVWPFPDERIRELARKIKSFVVPELNNGQISLEVERCSGGAAETILVPHMGGSVHDPQTILEAIRKAAK